MCNHEHKVNVDVDIDSDKAISGGMIIFGAIFLAFAIGLQYGTAYGFFTAALICGSLSYLLHRGKKDKTP